MQNRSKWDDLVRSRKFWAMMLVTLMSLGLYVMDELSAREVADLAGLVVGIYMGSVAVEDGLSQAMRVWLRNQEASREASRDLLRAVVRDGGRDEEGGLL